MLNKAIKLGRGFSIITIFSIAFLSIVSPLTSFASLDKPMVITGSVDSIDDSSATLNAFVDGNGLSTRVWFKYGRDYDLASTTSKVTIGTGAENFHKDLTNLRADTTYYFQAVAQNRDGTVYGDTFSFTTNQTYSNNNYYPQNNYYNYYDPTNYPSYYSNYDYQNYYTYPNYNQNRNSSAPTALTNAATDVGSESAQLNALILTNINDSSNAWFEWGSTPSLGNKTTVISVGALPAIRHANILNGLLPNTVYYFRAVAENSYYRNNGSVLSFVTEQGRAVQQYYPPATVTPEPTHTPTTDEPTVTPPVTPAPQESFLGANALGGFGTFFPGNIVGWMIIFILILILILLVRHPDVRFWNQDQGSGSHDAHH